MSALSHPREFEREREREKLRDSRWRRRREKVVLVVVAVGALTEGDRAWAALKAVAALAG